MLCNHQACLWQPRRQLPRGLVAARPNTLQGARVVRAQAQASKGFGNKGAPRPATNSKQSASKQGKSSPAEQAKNKLLDEFRAVEAAALRLKRSVESLTHRSADTHLAAAQQTVEEEAVADAGPTAAQEAGSRAQQLPSGAQALPGNRSDRPGQSSSTEGDATAAAAAEQGQPTAGAKLPDAREAELAAQNAAGGAPMPGSTATGREGATATAGTAAAPPADTDEAKATDAAAAEPSSSAAASSDATAGGGTAGKERAADVPPTPTPSPSSSGSVLSVVERQQAQLAETEQEEPAAAAAAAEASELPMPADIQQEQVQQRVEEQEEQRAEQRLAATFGEPDDIQAPAKQHAQLEQEEQPQQEEKGQEQQAGATPAAAGSRVLEELAASAVAPASLDADQPQLICWGPPSSSQAASQQPASSTATATAEPSAAPTTAAAAPPQQSITVHKVSKRLGRVTADLEGAEEHVIRLSSLLQEAHQTISVLRHQTAAAGGTNGAVAASNGHSTTSNASSADEGMGTAEGVVQVPQEQVGDVRSWQMLVGLLVDVMADVQGELDLVVSTLGHSRARLHKCTSALSGESAPMN